MSIKFTDEQKALLGVIDGPVWHDDCEHGLETYVASFKVLMPGPKLKNFDLYVFNEHGFGQSVCIRYGDEPGEYISPGSVLDFTKTACSHQGRLPEYWAAFDILRDTGQFTWKPTED